MYNRIQVSNGCTKRLAIILRIYYTVTRNRESQRSGLPSEKLKANFYISRHYWQ